MRKLTALLGLLAISSTVFAADSCKELFNSNTEMSSSISFERQVQVVEKYQAVGLAVNMFLRSGQEKWSLYMPSDMPMADYIKTLDQMISNAPTDRDLTLYRGEAYISLATIPKVGDIVLRKNYVSTSDDLAVAQRFTHGAMNIIFRIHLSKGQKALSLDPLISDPNRKDEREFLLPRESEMVVTNVQENLNYLLIDVKLR